MKYIKNISGQLIQLLVGSTTRSLRPNEVIYYNDVVIDNYTTQLVANYVDSNILAIIDDSPKTMARKPTFNSVSSYSLIVNFSPTIPVKCRVGTAGSIIQLTDLSYGISSTGNNSYLWTITPDTFNFVSGYSNTSKTPKILVTTPGEYTITEQVTNNDLNISASQTKTGLIKAYATTGVSGVANQLIEFINNAFGTYNPLNTVVGRGIYNKLLFSNSAIGQIAYLGYSANTLVIKNNALIGIGSIPGTVANTLVIKNAAVGGHGVAGESANNIIDIFTNSAEGLTGEFGGQAENILVLTNAAEGSFTYTTNGGLYASGEAIVSQVSGAPNGFTALLNPFPGPEKFVANTDTVMSSNQWLKGGRFGVNYENVCVTSNPASTSWDSEKSAVTGYTNPLNMLSIRIVSNPSSSFDITNTNTITYMDNIIAGIVSVANAAGTTDFLLDPENYSTSTHFYDYGSLLNSQSLSRSAMCAKMREFGAAFGESLWSRIPTATLYTFFGPSFMLVYPNGTQQPTTFPDSQYVNYPYYNMIPYFFLGLMDSCPLTGRIVDYMEQNYYIYTGLASLQRTMTASKNWVSIFFPTETSNISKASTCWIPVPMLYANGYFQQLSTAIPGANYVTNSTTQQQYFTRNCLYCLQQTPAGYLPAIYIEGYDSWGEYSAITNIPSTWATCINNSIAVYKGQSTLADLGINNTTLTSALQSAFSGNSTWRTESA